MSPEIRIKKIGFESLDIFPVFIDYDMSGMKCRGLSAKLDLFSYGALTAEIEKFSAESLEFAISDGILIRKSGLLFSGGFFLFDFQYIMENTDKFVEKLRALNVREVYLEKSERYDMALVAQKVNFCHVYLLEFGDA